MADKPASRLGLTVLRHVVALGLSTGVIVVGSFALPLWGFLVADVVEAQPTRDFHLDDAPNLLPCCALIGGGLFNWVVSLPVCLLVEWLVGDRGRLWWQLVFPTAMLGIFLVSAVVAAPLLLMDVAKFLGPKLNFFFEFFLMGTICAIPVLTYWVTLAGLRFILERPMAAGGASQGGAVA